jgi:hypothetical protein
VNPALSDAEKHVAAAHRFLVQTAHEFFRTDFDDLSEADLIVNPSVRSAIKRAEDAVSRDAANEGLEQCREALDAVESLIGEAVVVSEKSLAGPPVPTEFRGIADELVRWTVRRFAALEKSVALSILRINPSDYWFLYDSLPIRTAGGGFRWPPTRSPISARTAARARACLRIIVDLALRAERIHADLQRLAVQSGVVEEQKHLNEWKERLLTQSTTKEP